MIELTENTITVVGRVLLEHAPDLTDKQLVAMAHDSIAALNTFFREREQDITHDPR